MSHEIELKLTFPRAALSQIRRHPLIREAHSEERAQTLVNTYYDTPDLALKKALIGLRTRKAGRRWLQTVKSAASSSGGLSARREWEQPYAGGFDFSAIDDAQTLRRLHKHHPVLVPLFTTRFKRETRLHVPREGCRILIMIDDGEVVSGDGSRQEALCELELELAEGTEQDLLELACELAQTLPLTPSDVSKAERGYRLHAGVELTPLRAGPSPISAHLSPVEAFRALALDCMAQWQANASGAACSEDPEYIHQLRVALRRLRSALRIFSPALPFEFVERWSDELGDAAAQLGAARDLDVMIAELIQPVVSACPQTPGLAGLLEAVGKVRDAARGETAQHLAAAHHGRLLLRFHAELRALPSNALIASADLPTFARLQLNRLRKRVRRRYEAAIHERSIPLHTLRIGLKRLRYGVEFFAPLWSGRSGKPFARSLACIQDELGFLNDVEVARHRLQRIAGDSPELQRVVAYIDGFHAPRCLALHERLPQELQALLWGSSPWK